MSPFPNFKRISRGDRVAFAACNGGEPVDDVDVYPETAPCKIMEPIVPLPFDVSQGNVDVRTG